jgi:hypothetical protein
VNRIRIRTAGAVLAAAGAVAATQLTFVGSASAADQEARTPKPAAMQTQSTGCPIKIVYTSRFYLNSSGWVKGDGLYFGLKNTSSRTIRNVKFNVQNVHNIRFGRSWAKGGVTTHKSSTGITVRDANLKAHKSLGVQAHTRLLNTNRYKVKFTIHGSGWSCSVNQGTWGN